ncbi:5'-methylthioadenosine/S-adenosylhomocysteine nucleosidase family protein [Asticcacaulis machinosus]|uniref:Nucleoside phosphorylase domain-containing protein n=1 Tax=Asticcacaulis machinosus TaxID=2984211 RepID=A0ABT5HGD9_9CAUL|nr:hypothetical protein [Asticcacaulis machinosus]MDC7675161.1 hypothetical protein [Asticcacaulis machinosus]
MKNNSRRPKPSGNTPAPPHGIPYAAIIVVVIALQEENNTFHSVLRARGNTRWKNVPPSPRRTYTCDFHSEVGPVLISVQGLKGMGNIEAVLGTTEATTRLHPDLVILVGLGGSLHPEKVQLGDVILSNQAKLYMSDKVADIGAKKQGKNRYRFSDAPDQGAALIVDKRDKFMDSSFFRYERRFIESEGTHDLLGKAEHDLCTDLTWMNRVPDAVVPDKYKAAYSARSGGAIHSGWLLASSQVVDSAEFRDYLLDKNTSLHLDIHMQTAEPDRSHWKAGEILAVDMESYGVLKAVETLRVNIGNTVGGIVVRGVSDLCEEKVGTDDLSGNATRLVAVQNASEATLRIIEGMDFLSLFDT